MGRHDFARRQVERSLIRERTRAGRKAAMTRGVKFGRPPKLSAEQSALIACLADEGQTAPQIAETFGVHETTIYRCLGRAGALT